MENLLQKMSNDRLGRESSSLFGRLIAAIDWPLMAIITPLIGVGLITMNSFAEKNYFFDNQLIWVLVALLCFSVVSLFDLHFLRQTRAIMPLYFGICFILLTLFTLGAVFKGAQSWFNLGFFAFQPSDPAKLVLILVLAKYFSKRHVDIANLRHIVVSGMYALVVFLLILMQPDFGQAMIIFLIWFGMVLVSGISKKHLFLVFLIGVSTFSFLWINVFHDYQKQRILTFIHPLADIRGSGYNAFQSMVAVGSGQLTGKGIGYGTQSKLQFLPEYQTDFIFAAFAEEWGFVGVLVFFVLYGLLIWRILYIAYRGASNFEIFFGVGLAVMFIGHFIIHVGMNMGLLPVTGVTLPLVSYGGSHLLTEFIGLGMLMAMRRSSRGVHKTEAKNEFLGV
jgi:rod shape determining protein RodA